MRLYLYLGLATGAVLACWWVATSLMQAGSDHERAKQNQIIQEKTNAANHADDAVRKCISDPRCLMQDDGYQRK